MKLPRDRERCCPTWYLILIGKGIFPLEEVVLMTPQTRRKSQRKHQDILLWLVWGQWTKK